MKKKDIDAIKNRLNMDNPDECIAILKTRFETIKNIKKGLILTASSLFLTALSFSSFLTAVSTTKNNVKEYQNTDFEYKESILQSTKDIYDKYQNSEISFAEFNDQTNYINSYEHAKEMLKNSSSPLKMKYDNNNIWLKSTLGTFVAFTVMSVIGVGYVAYKREKAEILDEMADATPYKIYKNDEEMLNYM